MHDIPEPRAGTPTSALPWRRLLRSIPLLCMGLAACGGGGGGNNGDAGATTGRANLAPTVQAGPDQVIELPQDTAQLSGNAVDDNTSTLTYSWTTDATPTGATVIFGTPNAASTTARFSNTGSYQIRLTVSDGTASVSDALVITVNSAVYPGADPETPGANPLTDPHGWVTAAPADVNMDAAKLDQARAYAESGGGSGLISRRGRLVYRWGDIDQRFDVRAITQSIGSIALGLAVADARIALNMPAATYLPSFGIPPFGATVPLQCLPIVYDPSVLDDITVQQLATHTSGFESDACYGRVIRGPGSTWLYSMGGVNWLADLLTVIYTQDLNALLTDRTWSKIGITSDDLQWRDNAVRNVPPVQNGAKYREFGQGITANVNALARIGLLFLRRGVWGNERVLSDAYIDLVRRPAGQIANAAVEEPTRFPNVTANYGILWWTNASGALSDVPRDAYWAWGEGDSLLVVIPSLDLVVARTGNIDTNPRWRATWDGNYAVLDPFLTPIVQAVVE